MKRIIITTIITFCLLLAPVESFAASKPLTTTSTQTSITLKWTRLSAKEQKKVNGVAIFRNGKLVKKMGKRSVTFTDKGLKAGTTYSYQIKTYKNVKQKQWYNKKTKKWQVKKPAKKIRGKSRKVPVPKYTNYTSAKRVATTKPVSKTTTKNSNPGLTKPTLYIRSEGDDNLDVAVILNWDPVFAADKYKIYKGSEVFEVSSDQLVWTDKNVNWSTTYTYKVSAVKGSKEVLSDAKSVKTPDEPLALIAENGYFTDVSDMYSYINEWRQDPVNQWYRNTNDEIVYVSNLVMLERDEKLEEIAKQRAKEQWIVYYEQGKDEVYRHTRPDGQGAAVTVIENGMTLITECTIGGTALNRRNCIYGTAQFDYYDGWAETAAQYYGQEHRRAMLSNGANVKKVGFGAFRVGNIELIAMVLAY